MHKVLNTLFGVAIVVFVFLFGYQVRAQDTNQQITLSVSPTVFELSANPGEVIDNTFRIVNGTEQDLLLSATPKNFLANDELGGVNLTEDETSFTLSSWIEVEPAQIGLVGRGSQDFKFTISIPADAEPGSHLGAIIVQTNPQDVGGTGASVAQEAGPLILVKVAGDISEEASIVDFTTTKSFYENPPITFQTRVQNNGNVHFKPSGTISIKNMFGNEVTNINLTEQNILPTTIRMLENEWSPGFSVGRYTAELTLIYGPNDTIVTAQTSFTIFPYKVLVPLFIGVILLVFFLIRYRDRFKAAGKALSGKR
jgi:hypothetical protein